MARTKVERVVGIHAIGDSCESARVCQIVKRGKQFVFAEIAAIVLVRAVGGVFHFMGFDELVAQRQFLHKLLNDFSVVRGETWREGCNR